MTAGSDGVPAMSVVIPTRGTRAAVLAVTIARLVAEPCVKQVIVVGDRTIRLSPTADGRGVVSVVEAPGRGPNSSRQTGLDAATGEVVLFLDDDVLPDPGLAAGHAMHHAQARDRVVIGYMPVIRDAAGRYGSATEQLYALEYERRVKHYEADPGSILGNLWGGNVSLRCDDARRVGVENQAHPGRRHEDQDFGLRCAAAGLHGLFDRELLAAHHYRRSRRDFLLDAWAQGYERTLLRHNQPQSKWFTSGTDYGGAGSADAGIKGALRSAELVSLRAARRLQLYRGSARARRDTNQPERHPWQRRS